MDLTKYDAACQAIAEAKTVDEVKDMRDKAEAMRAYARQAKNRQLEVDAAEIRIRAERRLGELIKLQKGTVGLAKPGPKIGTDEGPNYMPTLADVGIDKNLSSRAQKLAAVPEDKFEGMLGGWRERVGEETERITVHLLGGGHVRGTLGSGQNEWYTPTLYIEKARKVLDGIGLDPASSEQAQKNVKATKYYTIEQDGLLKNWEGNVWLNPPYAQPLIGNFIDKLVLEIKARKVCTAILLTHNYTDTEWFHKAANECKLMCFTKGRVKFESPDGTIASPTQGQTFFMFGSVEDMNNGVADAFKTSFSDVGFVVEKTKI